MNEEQRESLRFMRNECLWSAWPLLPLKRREREPGIGILIARAGPVVYLENLFGLHYKYNTISEILAKASRIEYASFEKIIEDGWVVD